MDAEKIKNFFIFHIEKMILVAVLGAAGFLAYSGFTKEPITKKHDPKRLTADANQVKASVDELRTEAIVKERRPEFDIDKAIVIKTQPVPGDKYPLEIWEPGSSTGDDSGIKRRDPELLAALEVQAVGVAAPMAILSRTETYFLQSLETADPVEFEKPPEKKKKKKTRRSRGGGMEMMMEDMMDMEAMEMEQMEMGMGMEMDGPGMGMMAGDSAKRMMDSEGVEGFRPTAKVTKPNSTLERYSVPDKGSFIAGTAVVPYKLLHQNYENSFLNAEGFNPLRDRPTFLGYELQRADVTTKSVDELVEEDWVNRYGSSKMPILANFHWAGFNKELVAKEYREDGVLTMWIPPVMMNDYSSFSLHPMIPMKTASQIKREQMEMEMEKQREEEAKGFGDFDQFEVTKGASQNAGGGMYGGGMYGEDMMESGGDDMGMGMGDMYGGGMGGSVARMLDQNPVEYKLIRFYDFENPPIGLKDKNPPKMNRKYVYRVRCILDDPNFPEDPNLQPIAKTLDGDTYTRVTKLVSMAAKTKTRSSELKTPWSKPCAPVSLVTSGKAYAGPVVKPGSQKSVAIANRTITYEVESPRVEMVIEQFNETYSTDVTMLIKDVGEGTVLAAKAEFADVVDPITLEVKKAPDVAVMTTTTVIDIEGGQALSIVQDEDDEKLMVPSSILLFDENGGLRVQGEAGDQKRFRAKSFASERGK